MINKKLEELRDKINKVAARLGISNKKLPENTRYFLKDQHD